MQPQYPYPPQQPPQAYPPAPQYAPPQQPPAPQYAPPPPPPAAPAAPTQVAPNAQVPGDVAAFVDPTAGEARPSWAELAGRLVAIVPLRIDPPSGRADDLRPNDPTAHFDLYVLDGSWPLHYGAAPTKQRPATHMVQGPARFAGMQTQNTNMFRAVQSGLGRGTVLGVIELSTVGNKGNKPWNITALDTEDPRRQLAAQIFGAVQAGTLRWAEPIELGYAPPVAPAPQGYPQAYAQPVYGQQPQPPQYAAPAPAQQWQQPPAPPAPQQYAPLQPGNAWGVVVPPGLQRPEQIPEQIWAQLPPDQQQAAIAQLQAQAQHAGQQQRPNPF